MTSDADKIKAKIAWLRLHDSTLYPDRDPDGLLVDWKHFRALLDIAETLDWYAHHADYLNACGGEGHIGLDRGLRARKALQALGDLPNEV